MVNLYSIAIIMKSNYENNLCKIKYFITIFRNNKAMIMVSQFVTLFLFKLAFKLVWRMMPLFFLAFLFAWMGA